MIEHYEFGKIIINGKKYDRDLILYPNKIGRYFKNIFKF